MRLTTLVGGAIALILGGGLMGELPADQAEACAAYSDGFENQSPDDVACLEAMKARVAELEGELDSARGAVAELERRLAAGRKPAIEAIHDPGVRMADSDVRRRSAASPFPDDEARASHPSGSLATTRTTLNHGKLQSGGIQDISRLDRLVPGLQFGRAGHDVRLSMRGARNNAVGPQAQPVIGIHEDGVYVPTTMQAMEPYLDVAQIEVLRGPQGIAYGRNSMGGAIHITTNAPSFDAIEGRVEGVLGRFDRARFEGVFNVPFNDRWAFRFAALADGHSGIVDNPILESDADDLWSSKTQLVRAALKWRPGDAFDATLKVQFLDKNGNGTGIWGYQQAGAYIAGQWNEGHQFAPPGAIQDRGPYVAFRNFLAKDDMENLSGTLTVNWDMGFASLAWISNYTELEAIQIFDSDYSSGGPDLDSDFAGWDNFQDSWSSELRLTSNGDSALDWVLGLYTFERKADWRWLQASDGGFFQAAWDAGGRYIIDSRAAYGRLGYALSDRWRLSGELRWFKDGKTLRSGESDSWDDIIWKAAAEFDLSADHTAYFSASTGARSGGLNDVAGVATGFDTEKVTALEAGLRSHFADGRARLNAAAYYNDYSDVRAQSWAIGPVPGSPGALEYFTNGGSMTAKGAEVEFQWMPNDNWDFSAQLAYLDARFGNYVVPFIAGLGEIPGHTDGENLSLKGWRPAFSPKWTLGLQAGYMWHTSDHGTFRPYVQTYYTSEYSGSDINLPGALQDSRTATDVRLTWMAPGGRFRFEGYFLNIEDKASLSHAMIYNPAARPTIATVQTQWRKPRLMGLIFSYDF